MPLWLIGMMGAGKSTLGKIIAERKGWKFIDTDDVVMEAAGRDITELFATEGESGFRIREADAVAAVSSHPGAVVATGGGAVLRSENVDTMRRTGLIFWLQADPATLAARIAMETKLTSRPLIFDDDVEATLRGILDERQGAYRAAADFAISTDLLAPEEAADLVEALWHD
ncbi:MAG TPA: shikimate kinase [Acidimicrobiia bacterium]|nr:shikimate kinase [Acidimicrobiia bacterium]